jgi:hypothetical protein
MAAPGRRKDTRYWIARVGVRLSVRQRVAERSDRCSLASLLKVCFEQRPFG